MSNVPSKRIVLARYATSYGEIQLQQRPLDTNTLAYEIIIDGVFLMACYNQASERALARCALAKFGSRIQTRSRRNTNLRLLIGGLGMGFTLQEALSNNSVASVEVVELSSHVIDWNRTYFAPLNGDALSDSRVTIIQADLWTVLETGFSQDAQYHSILLDVDNGPSWLVYDNNARLYTPQALTYWLKMLVPGGILAVWSAQREPELFERLKALFFEADEVSIATQLEKKLAKQYIYLAVAGSS